MIGKSMGMGLKCLLVNQKNLRPRKGPTQILPSLSLAGRAYPDSGYSYGAATLLSRYCPVTYSVLRSSSAYGSIAASSPVSSKQNNEDDEDRLDTILK